MLKAEIEHRNKKQERTTNIMPTNPGEYVKKIRTEQNLTLKELSKKSGLSVSFLSQFERGISTISVDALLVLADALGIDSREVIMESLATSQPKEDYVLRSYNRHIPQISANNQIQTSLSSFGYDKKMLARMYTLLPDGSEEKTLPVAHEGEEFIYVLEGILTLEIDNVRYDLHPEDTAHFPSTKKHMWYNETNRNVKFILINYPYFSKEQSN